MTKTPDKIYDQNTLNAAIRTDDFDTALEQFFCLAARHKHETNLVRKNGPSTWGYRTQLRHYRNESFMDRIYNGLDLQAHLLKDAVRFLDDIKCLSTSRQINIIEKLTHTPGLLLPDSYLACAAVHWISSALQSHVKTGYASDKWPEFQMHAQHSHFDTSLLFKLERHTSERNCLSSTLGTLPLNMLALRPMLITKPKYKMAFEADVNNAVLAQPTPLAQMAAIDTLLKIPSLPDSLTTRLCRTAIEQVLPKVGFCADMSRRDYVQMIDFATGMNKLLEDGCIAPTLRPEFAHMATGFLDVVIELSLQREQFPHTHSLIDQPNAAAALAVIASSSTPSAGRAAGLKPQPVPAGM